MAPRSSIGSSVWADSVTIGVAIEPNATGAVLPISDSAAALIGEKPSAISITDGDGDRGAEAGEALDQRAEGEGDDDGLDALVVGDPRERTPQHREVPRPLGHVVDPDRVDDDPHDREEAEGRALEAHVERLADRHVVDERPRRRSRPRARRGPRSMP